MVRDERNILRTGFWKPGLSPNRVPKSWEHPCSGAWNGSEKRGEERAWRVCRSSGEATEAGGPGRRARRRDPPGKRCPAVGLPRPRSLKISQVWNILGRRRKWRQEGQDVISEAQGRCVNPAATAGEGRKERWGWRDCTQSNITRKPWAWATGLDLTTGQDSSERPREAKTQKKLRGRQQEQEECLSLSLSSLLVKQRGPGGSSGLWRLWNHHLGDETVSKARRGISLARQGLACLQAVGPLDTSADTLRPGSRGWEGWHGGRGLL